MPRGRMDVDSVLLSVQERDKWRRRLQVLEKSLGDTRAKRDRLRGRLRRIKKDLDRLVELSEATLAARLILSPPGGVRAPSDVRLPAR
jgi:hypothetical protein